MNTLKIEAIITLLPITFGLVVAGIFGLLIHAALDGGGPTPQADAAPAVSAEAESSSRVNVKSLAGNLEFLGDKPMLTGHPLLIEFWATWCPPCRASIDHLNDLDKEYHARGLDIVGVTTEDKPAVERLTKNASS